MAALWTWMVAGAKPWSNRWHRYWASCGGVTCSGRHCWLAQYDAKVFHSLLYKMAELSRCGWAASSTVLSA